MDKPPSGALVCVDARRDLAYKKVVPALQRTARRGKLGCRVIGVAKSGWTQDQLVERARASVTENGGEDPEAFARLVSELRYVDGDYADPDTFGELKGEPTGCRGPARH